MSCRVIGRTVETALLARWPPMPARAGARRACRAGSCPRRRTRRRPEFYREHGFEVAERQDGCAVELDLTATILPPEWVRELTGAGSSDRANMRSARLHRIPASQVRGAAAAPRRSRSAPARCASPPAARIRCRCPYRPRNRTPPGRSDARPRPPAPCRVRACRQSRVRRARRGNSRRRRSIPARLAQELLLPPHGIALPLIRPRPMPLWLVMMKTPKPASLEAAQRFRHAWKTRTSAGSAQ